MAFLSKKKKIKRKAEFLFNISVEFIFAIYFEKDQLNEWANMTGFLCALGGVRLSNKSQKVG